MVAIKKSVLSGCYKLTSSFEGSGYANITGNFDGQGFSIGFLQWCIGQGSGQTLLNLIYAANPKQFEEIMTKEFVVMLKSNDKNQQMAFAKKINDSKNNIIEPWKSRLKKLLNSKEGMAAQDELAMGVMSKAEKMCQEYGLKSARGLALMFDICTQNGSISSKTKQVILEDKAKQEKAKGKKLSEVEFMVIIATRRAEASNPQWSSDVKKRKLTIATGTGTVHGEFYNLEKYGLTLEPYSSEGLRIEEPAIPDNPPEPQEEPSEEVVEEEGDEEETPEEQPETPPKADETVHLPEPVAEPSTEPQEEHWLIKVARVIANILQAIFGDKKGK